MTRWEMQIWLEAKAEQYGVPPLDHDSPSYPSTEEEYLTLAIAIIRKLEARKKP